MKSQLISQLRAKRNAVLSMQGTYPEKHLQLSTARIREHGLIDDWMREKQAIFVHIPKAAGRSIQHTLGIPIHDVAHIPAEAYRRADPEFWAQCYSFSIIRNPWDRLVSAFHFMRKNDHPYNLIVRNTDLLATPDFATFLRRLRRKLYRHQILSRLHFMPQTHFLCDPQGAVMVDAIGRFEELPGSFNALTERLPGEYELQERNRTAHKGFREYYEHDWQVALVGEMYASDVAQFGYRFED